MVEQQQHASHILSQTGGLGAIKSVLVHILCNLSNIGVHPSLCVGLLIINSTPTHMIDNIRRLIRILIQVGWLGAGRKEVPGYQTWAYYDYI